MADRAAARLAIDLVFATAIIAFCVTTYARTLPPAMPAHVCTTETGGPRYDRMLADGRITIAAVFGELEGGPGDPNAWSYRAFATSLRERGFVEVDVDRYQLGDVTIDLALIGDDLGETNAALAGALASHDVVYYNGHSHRGEIALAPGNDYRLIVLDSCWSTQHFAIRLISPDRDVITNTERSVTGSIDSFLVLVDALRAGESHWPITEMNSRANDRALRRAPFTQLDRPEHYRVDVPCT